MRIEQYLFNKVFSFLHYNNNSLQNERYGTRSDTIFIKQRQMHYSSTFICVSISIIKVGLLYAKHFVKSNELNYHLMR